MKNMVQKVKSFPIIERLRKTKWKNCIERYLLPSEVALRLIDNPDQIESVLEKHVREFPEHTEQIVSEIKMTFEANTELSEELIQDILFWHYAFGFTVGEYCCYGFLNKDSEERLKFISEREILSFGYEVNNLSDIALFSDKELTYKTFGEYYYRDAICVESSNDYQKFAQFVDEHPVFVKKEVYEACGRSVELVNSNETEQPLEELFKSIISHGKTIVEEVIKQSPKMKALNESSVNTIRCITLNDRKEIVIPCCFAKIGRRGAFIDNGAAGGILVGIDIETGIMNTSGIDENGIRYEMHPDSGIALKGYRLPEWDKMKTMCKKMSEMTPGIRFIGWDMAYSEDGWVVVEGNALSEAIGIQSPYCKGIRSELTNYLKQNNVSLERVLRYHDAT